MNSNQKKRLQKVNYEPFYLLNLSKNEKNNLIFDVSGSTANLYQTTIYPESQTVFCNCPDARSWAKKQGCICKHACFVFLRVLKITEHELTTNLFSRNLIMTQGLVEKVENKVQELQQISLRNQEFVNNDFLDKFQQMKLGTDMSKEKSKEDDKYIAKKEIEEDEECMICFDEMDDVKKCVECPLCHNLIHKECMKKWLENGHKTCIYCRSEVWKDFGKKETESKYKNLLD